MKSLQADFFKVMKEGAFRYGAPFRFWVWFWVECVHKTEEKERFTWSFPLFIMKSVLTVLVLEI